MHFGGVLQKYPKVICLDFYEARIVFRLKSLLLFSIAIDMIDMKRIIAISCLLAFCFCGAYAQTGAWSGIISVQGTDLPLVFHIGDNGATMDSPAQGVRGIPAGGINCIEAVDGVNHMFQHCATGATIEYREVEETFSPEVLQKIITWIESL